MRDLWAVHRPGALVRTVWTGLRRGIAYSGLAQTCKCAANTIGGYLDPT